MSATKDARHVSASVPWKDAKHTNWQLSRSWNSLHYKGWVLVDVFTWRYAVNDKTNERIRICGVHTSAGDALRKFRKAVDARELASDVIRLRESGVGSPEVARRLDTSRSVVNKIMRNHAKVAADG